MRKTTIAVLSGIAAWLLLVAMLLGGVFVCTTSRAYYRHEYAKYGQAQVIGIDNEGLMRVTDGLLDYLWGARENLDMQEEIRGELREVFNDREKAHMVDVQRLVLLSRIVMAAAFVLGIALWLAARLIAGKRPGCRKWAGIGYLIGAGLLLLAVGTVVLLAIRDFTAVFIRFHLIFFDNDLWLLDPDDMLIQMVPEYFFSDCAVVIAVLFGIGLLITSVLAVIMIVKDCGRKEKGILRKINGSDGESFYCMESSAEAEEKAPNEEEIFDRFGLNDKESDEEEFFAEPREEETPVFSTAPTVIEREMPVSLEGADITVRFEMKLDLKVEKRGDGQLVMVMDPEHQPQVSLTSLPGHLSIRLDEEKKESEASLNIAKCVPSLESVPAPEELLRQVDQLMQGYPDGNEEEEK